MNLSLICMALIFWANWTHASEISRPLVIAHRGARSLAPENTLAAAMAAWRLGADGWELDVRMTKDGELIVMHDETLSRTTNAPSLFPNRSPWLVSDFTLEEIKMLDAGSWFVDQDPYATIAVGEVSPEEAAKFRGEKVPTLKEALALTKELGFWVNIELKSRPSFALSPQTKALADRTVALIREMGLVKNVLISSFDPAVLQYLAKVAPDIPRALLVSSLPSDLISYLQALEVEALNPRYDLVTESLLQTLSQAGFQIYIWTVNEPEGLKRFSSDSRITGIITDWPQRLLSILGRNQ